MRTLTAVARVSRLVTRGLVAVTLGACEGTPRQSSAVQIGVVNAVRGIKPGYALEYSEGQVTGMVFESLTKRDSLGEALPWLAKRWVSTDSQMWTFTLHANIRFHDGTPLRANDVVRSWTALVADSIGGDEPPGVFMFVRGAQAVRDHQAADIEGLHVVDDTTLRVDLTRREPGFARTLGSLRLGVAAAMSQSWSPVGTGPWRFTSRSRNDSVLSFARFDGYWNVRTVSESLVVRVVGASGVAAAFAAGRLDCFSDLSDGDALTLSTSRGLRLVSTAPLTRLRLVVNFTNPALRDVRVRRALLLALDRQMLARSGGLFSAIVSDGMVPPSLLPPTTTLPTPYDPDSARTLLVAAGFSASNPLRLTTRHYADARSEHGLEVALGAYWRAVGVRVDATGGATDEPSTRAPADIEVFIEEPGIATPEEYLSLVAIERPYGRVVATPTWENEQFRSLFKIARSTRNTAGRDSAIRAMLHMVSDSLPSLPLFFLGSSNARSLRIDTCDETMPRYGRSRVSR